MDGLWANIAGQTWVTGLATLAGAVVAATVTVMTSRSSNSWEKRRHESVKAKLDIAKTLKDDFKDDEWQKWVAMAKKRGEHLLDPLSRTEGIAIGGMAISVTAGFILLQVTQRLGAGVPGTTAVFDLPTGLMVALISAVLAAVVAATFTVMAIYAAVQRVSLWLERKLVERQDRKRTERESTPTEPVEPEPDDSGFLPRPSDQHSGDS